MAGKTKRAKSTQELGIVKMGKPELSGVVRGHSLSLRDKGLDILEAGDQTKGAGSSQESPVS